MSSLYMRRRTLKLPASSRSRSVGGSHILAVQRAPTDPYFYASLTLQNVVIGSRYWVAQTSNLSNVIANGDASGGDIVLSGIAALQNPMLLTIRVRKGTTSTKYKPFETAAYLVKAGATAYISQQVDPVA